MFPPHPQQLHSYLEQADFPLVRYHPPAWGHCPQVLHVWMDLSYWLHILGGWRACWSLRDLCYDTRGLKQVLWSVWRVRPQPGGTGCWCCCCWGRQRQSRNGSARRPLGSPTQRTGSSVSMFSLSLSGPVGTGRKACKVITECWRGVLVGSMGYPDLTLRYAWFLFILNVCECLSPFFFFHVIVNWELEFCQCNVQYQTSCIKVYSIISCFLQNTEQHKHYPEKHTN